MFESCFKVGNAEPLTCTHCDMVGHTAEKCYKFNGYPPGHKLYNKSKSIGAYANQAIVQQGDEEDVIADSPFSLSKGQYHELLALLKAKSPATATPSANHIQTMVPSYKSSQSISSIPLCSSAHTTPISACQKLLALLTPVLQII